MHITIRPATPDDIPFLAQILDLAARSHVATGMYDYLFAQPPDSIRTFCAGLLGAETRSWAHYSSYLVAAWGGTPAAALAGYDVAERGFPVLVAALKETMAKQGWTADAQARCWERMAVLEPCFAPDIPGAWVVESVATLPAYRQRGLIAALLTQVLADGRARGHSLAQISMLIGNTPAQQAYERVGFRITTERRDPAFAAALGAPGLVQMTRPLTVGVPGAQDSALLGGAAARE